MQSPIGGQQRPAAPMRLLAPAVMLGTGLSGFFDGILLHQVLQWHHLLSLVPEPGWRDPETQILADGLFHVLMYVVTGASLWLLFKRRSQAAMPDSARTLVGGATFGFGLWNLIDVAFFHWILGIHRIRVNVPDPLVYDIVWLAALGLVPMMAGALILRRGPSRRGTGAAIGLAIIAATSATVAALPARDGETLLVYFAPGAVGGNAMNAVLDNGRIVWADPDAQMFAIVPDGNDAALALRQRGALVVTRSPVLAGCVSRLTA